MLFLLLYAPTQIATPRSPNRRARSVDYGRISSLGHPGHYGHHHNGDGDVGLVPVPKGILKTNHHGTNGKSPSRNEGSCCCCIDHLAVTAAASEVTTTTASANWPQPPSLPLHHPDHPFHFHVSHCHTANAQWRPEDQVAVLQSDHRGCPRGQGSGAITASTAASPNNLRNPIALKSKNTTTAGKTSWSNDLFYNGGGRHIRGRALDSYNTAAKVQTQNHRTNNLRPLGKKNGKSEAISASKTTSSSLTTSSSKVHDI